MFLLIAIGIPYAIYKQYEKEILRAFRRPLVTHLLPDQIVPPG